MPFRPFVMKRQVFIKFGLTNAKVIFALEKRILNSEDIVETNKLFTIRLGKNQSNALWRMHGLTRCVQ